MTTMRLSRGFLAGALLAFTLTGIFSVGAHGSPQAAQKSYATPDEAVADLLAAVQSSDVDLLFRIFGPELEGLISGDTVQQSAELESFSKKAAEQNKLVKAGEDKYFLNLGSEEWPFPIPLVRKENRWTFATEEGIEELIDRRVGENEINTISVCQAYAAAQWEYFLEGDWDSDQVQEFAQRLVSRPGQKDGLYWPTTSAEPQSPLGPLVALSQSEGYLKDIAGAAQEREPYYGYYFKILKAQGPNAPGGAHNYVVNGNMIGGFALVAYPVVYGSSGVMTFIVNQQGRPYQKDLGPNTQALAEAMVTYNPDATWKVAELLGAVPAPEPSMVQKEAWQVTHVEGLPVSLPDGKMLTIQIEESGRFTATAGLNQLAGTYTLTGPRLSFGPVISTRRAGPPELMKLEGDFIRCLATVASIELSNDQLYLLDSIGVEQLRLSKLAK